MHIHDIILKETFVNFLPGQEDRKSKYAEEIFAMLQGAYASQGGIKGSGFESPQAMVDKIPMWKIAKRDGDVVAVTMYKDKGGRKMVAAGTDGSKEGKAQLAEILKDDVLKGGRSYAEVSGGALGFYRRILGDEALSSVAIHPSKVKEILPQYEIKQIDDVSYSRQIGGEWIEKMMLGTIGKTIQ